MKSYKLVLVLITVVTRFNFIQSRATDNRNTNNRKHLHNSTSQLDLINSLSESLRENRKNDIQIIPETCEQVNGKKLEKQPIANDLSRIKKCCPIGQSFYKRNGKVICDTEKYPFKVEPIAVELYDNCIENLEEPIHLEISAGYPCANHDEFYSYSKTLGDLIFVIQNGSLLEMDENGNDSYEIIQDYCLDVNDINGDLTAFTCLESMDTNYGSLNYLFLTKITVLTISAISAGIFILISKRLDKKYCLICILASIYAATVYILHIYEIFNPNNNLILGDFIKYFIFCYFGCFFIQCLEVPIIKLDCNSSFKYGICRMIFFIVSVIIAILNPVILVLNTLHEKILKMPLFSYQSNYGVLLAVSWNILVILITILFGVEFIFLLVTSYNLGHQSSTTNNSKIKKTLIYFWALLFINLSAWILVVAYVFPNVADMGEISDFLILPFISIIILVASVLNDKENPIISPEMETFLSHEGNDNELAN